VYQSRSQSTSSGVSQYLSRVPRVWNSSPTRVLCFYFLPVSMRSIGTFRSAFLVQVHILIRQIARFRSSAWHSAENVRRSPLTTVEPAPLMDQVLCASSFLRDYSRGISTIHTRGAHMPMPDRRMADATKALASTRPSSLFSCDASKREQSHLFLSKLSISIFRLRCIACDTTAIIIFDLA